MMILVSLEKSACRLACIMEGGWYLKERTDFSRDDEGLQDELELVLVQTIVAF